MRKYFFYILLLFTLLSCSKDIDTLLSPQERTLLAYLAGDNNLSHEVADIHASLVQGWNSEIDGSLLVFADSRGEDKPMLIQIKSANNQTISDTLRQYDDDNSASSDLFRQVIADTKLIAPANSYGLLLFSHASGWLPPKVYSDPMVWEEKQSGIDPFRIVPRSVFEDNGREMELADFAAAIPDGTFDFIASEMCFMSGVETAYALRNKTDYLLASAPEVLSPGFTPIYKTSLKLLYESTPDLKGFAQDYFDYFNGLQGAYRSAAISVVKTSEMDALAALTREITLPQLAQQEINQVQRYDGNFGRDDDGVPNLFFDYRDYISKTATSSQLDQVDALLDKVVLFKRNTPKLIDVTLAKHSGLSTYIQQERLPRLNAAYRETAWYKAVSY